MAADLKSSYLENLPAVFSADPLVPKLLLAFERILSGLPAGSTPSGLPVNPAAIEAILDRITVFFNPGPGVPDNSADGLPLRAPDEFLPWLAQWVATSLRDDWDAETKRQFIQNIPALYRERGTIDCLETMLSIYLYKDNGAGKSKVTVDDSSPTPHYFDVSFTVGGSAADLARYDQMARVILDQEKPAHTYYGLAISFPSLQIVDAGASDTTHKTGIWVGQNTVLGTTPSKP